MIQASSWVHGLFLQLIHPGESLDHNYYYYALYQKKDLRQSLPAAGIIEESESARGERGRVGQGRVGFRV